MTMKARYFVGLFFLFCTFSIGRAQTFNDFKSQIREKYTSFEQETQQKFNDFVASIDQEFADHLSANFSEYIPEKIASRLDAPKPVSIPKTTEEEVVTGNVISFLPPKTQLAARQGSLLPGIKKTENTGFETVSTEISFLGKTLNFASDKHISEIRLNALTPESISQYWLEMGKTNYNHILAQLTETKDILNANDWAYYLLIKNFTQSLLPNQHNEQIALQWVLLNRSRYKAKVGFQGNKAFLMLPSLFTIYGLDYIAFDQLNYYVLDNESAEINTYNFDFPEADIVMDLRILKPFNTQARIDQKQLSFVWENQKHTVDVYYDMQMIDFYKSMPQLDIAVYLNSVCSEVTKNSLMEQFEPILKGKSEVEAAAVLLSFVQQGFEYKTDEEVFNQEHYFFADELFYYPYADCEDRSVLYTYLVKTLLKRETLALGFPGHMATAIHFEQTPEGDFLNWNGKHYVVADPTFVGAPLGMLLTQVQGKKPLLIPISNTGTESKRKSVLWDLVNHGGGYQGDKLTDVVFDKTGNAYLCGYFVSEAKFGNKILSGNGNNRDGFVAKFNEANQIQWASTFTGSGNDMAFNLAFSSDGNLLVYGNLENELRTNETEIRALGAPDVFVAEFTPDGQLKWIQKAGIDKLDHNADFMFAARFNKQGEKTMARLFSEAEQFNYYGLTAEADGSALITGSFFATTGMNTHDFTAYQTSSTFDAGESLKTVNDTLVQLEYEKTIAGLFAAMQLVKSNTIEIKGSQIQQVLEKYNKPFTEFAKSFYTGFGKMQFIRNNSGIVTIRTDDGNSLVFDKIKIDNEARIKIIMYKSGNVEVQVFSGIDVGVPGNWHSMNTIKLYKSTGDLLLDFDEGHVTKKLNLKTEILKKL